MKVIKQVFHEVKSNNIQITDICVEVVRDKHFLSLCVTPVKRITSVVNEKTYVYVFELKNSSFTSLLFKSWITTKEIKDKIENIISDKENKLVSAVCKKYQLELI